MKDYYDDDNEQYEYGNSKEQETENEEGNPKKVSSWLLTFIQITVCGILFITALFLRFDGGNAYHYIRTWYIENISKTIVPDEQIENVKEKVVELFPAASQNPAVSGVNSAANSQQASSQPASSQSFNQQGNAPSLSSSASPNSAGSQQQNNNAQSGLNSQQTASSTANTKSAPPVESQSLIN